MLRTLLGSVVCLVCVQTPASDVPITWSPDAETRIVEPGADGQWKTMRVGGDMNAAVIQRGIIYTIGSCRIDTELPEGYPIPTAPGAVEIKRYPEIRRAEYTTPMDDADASRRAGNRGFWPLFRHIEARSIPMTSPVEMDYHGMTIEEPGGLRAWTMSFLYRTPEEGVIETDGRVRVVNTGPVTVLSSGVRGVFNGEMLEAQIGVLRSWLEGQDAWRASGDVRVFQYNGPMTRPGNRWVEVQVPVEHVRGASAGGGAGANGAHAARPDPADAGVHGTDAP
jgi:hypothetical protein